MNENVTLRIKPVREFYYNDDSNYGIYACEPLEKGLVKLNQWNNFSLKGNTIRLEIGSEYNAKLKEGYDSKYGTYYEIVSIFEDIPKDPVKQRKYLKRVLTKRQVDALYEAYPNQDIIQLISEDKVDISKVKGLGEISYEKVKQKVIENLEYQKAYDFLSEHKVTNNLIVKLVEYFKSASLLIKIMSKNPYCITEVSGVGFKTADAIALSMKFNPKDKERIKAAIEFVVEEESNNGHTYCTTDTVLKKVNELTNVEEELINEYIQDTEKVIIVGNKVALKKNYYAERYIVNRLKELLKENCELKFDVEKFIQEQEEKHKIQLTEQQKQFYHFIHKYRVNILAGFSGTGKSYNVQLLINLLERLGVTYRLLSPTGKAAKVLANYTNRRTETIHRAIGLGLKREDYAKKRIEEEFIIIDETSMVDVLLCEKLLRKCEHPNVRLLFIGDPAQLTAVSAGNLLHDMINSKVIPTTQLTTVFRQKEGGALDIITKIRQNQRFVNNDFWGIKEFGENCIVACVPQDKMVKGYHYFFKKYLEEFNSDDITVATPTKKGKLGTVEINNQIQTLVNPKREHLKEKPYGQNEVVFRVNDLVLNTVNSYQIQDIYGNRVDIVNGDIGKVVDIDFHRKEVIVDFEFAKVPFEFNKLNQLLHCWSMTTHKLQGSSNKVIIVIADKSQKFQLNANLLYTACGRTTDKLILISQAETINFAMRRKANLQRNTFLQSMLLEEE